MATIEETAKEIEEEFGIFGDDWESKYEHVIDLGRSLPLIDPALKTQDRLIRGCQSQVWLSAEKKNGLVHFSADSDAIITKGLVALVIRVLSGHSPGEIAKADLGFIDRIGLREHLSPTRANGLVSMINTMKQEAVRMI
jgi:cysteine desulfuration protein SufE